MAARPSAYETVKQERDEGATPTAAWVPTDGSLTQSGACAVEATIPARSTRRGNGRRVATRLPRVSPQSDTRPQRGAGPHCHALAPARGMRGGTPRLRHTHRNRRSVPLPPPVQTTLRTQRSGDGPRNAGATRCHREEGSVALPPAELPPLFGSDAPSWGTRPPLTLHGGDADLTALVASWPLWEDAGRLGAVHGAGRGGGLRIRTADARASQGTTPRKAGATATAAADEGWLQRPSLVRD